METLTRSISGLPAKSAWFSSPRLAQSRHLPHNCLETRLFPAKHVESRSPERERKSGGWPHDWFQDPINCKDSRRVQEPGGLDAKRLDSRLTLTWTIGLPRRPAALRFSRLGWRHLQLPGLRPPVVPDAALSSDPSNWSGLGVSFPHSVPVPRRAGLGQTTLPKEWSQGHPLLPRSIGRGLPPPPCVGRRHGSQRKTWIRSSGWTWEVLRLEIMKVWSIFMSASVGLRLQRWWCSRCRKSTSGPRGMSGALRPRRPVPLWPSWWHPHSDGKEMAEAVILRKEETTAGETLCSTYKNWRNWTRETHELSALNSFSKEMLSAVGVMWSVWNASCFLGEIDFTSRFWVRLALHDPLNWNIIKTLRFCGTSLWMKKVKCSSLLTESACPLETV